MKRVDLRALFRLMAGPEFDELPDDTINDWLSEAHRYICGSFRVYALKEPITFGANANSVSLAGTRFVGLHDGYGNDGSLIDQTTNQGLIEITPAEARLKTISGHDVHVWFWVWDREIFVLPVIGSAKSFDLLGFYLDVDFVNDQSYPKYPEAYHELLVTYVLYKAYLSKVQEGTRDKRALTHWNLFKEQVNMVKANERGRSAS